MKFKKYCEEVVHEFIRRGVIKIEYKNNQPIFNFDLLRTPRISYYNEPFQMSVGDGAFMVYLGVKDVVSFNKDGNIITFNVKDILKSYKEIV